MKIHELLKDCLLLMSFLAEKKGNCFLADLHKNIARYEANIFTIKLFAKMSKMQKVQT